MAVWNGTILGIGAEPGKRMMIDGANVDRAGRATVPLGIGGDQDHCRGMTSARDRIVLENVNGGRACGRRSGGKGARAAVPDRERVFSHSQIRSGHGVGRIRRLDLLEYSSPRRVPTRYASERSAVAINRSSPIAAWSCRVRAIVVCFPSGSPAVGMGVPNVTRTRGRCTKCAIRTSLGP